MLNKKISVKISKCIEVNKEQYTNLKIIPSKSCKNTNTDKILILANTMYRKINHLIKIENKKLIINSRLKLSYYIHFTKDKVEFYFIVPTVFLNQIITKLSEIWKNVEINEVVDIPISLNEGTKYQLYHKLNDALSLDVDKRSNDLLNANMSILEVLKDDESIGIFYNFIPSGQREQEYFKKHSNRAIEEYKQGTNLKKNKNIIDLGIVSLKFTLEFIEDLLKGLVGSNKTISKRASIEKNISTSTQKKLKGDTIKTQIIIGAKSSSKNREKQLCNSLYNTFSSIEGDNQLKSKEIKKDIDFYKSNLGVDYNNISTLEGGNFINIPGRELIEQYKVIKHNKVLELKAPRCLENGEVRIGTVKYKDTKQEVYYSTDKEIKKLGRVLLGGMGAGKDYYMTNMAKDIIKANRGLVVIDYIDTCQLADSIKKITPKEKLIEIDCSNPKTLQTLAYGEFRYEDSDEEYLKINICMQKAQQYNFLLDTINDVNSSLTPRMLRYLGASAVIAFRNNQDASLKDVIDILRNPNKRQKEIDKLPQQAKDMLKDEIGDLEDLSKICKNGSVENSDSKIDGIIDRISKLKSSSVFTKLAYTEQGNNNIDFIKVLNEGKVVLIKIPAKEFSKNMRSLLATFYLQKVWIAKERGAKQTQTELFINEIHQSQHCQILMEDILVECRKFNLTPTLAIHYLNQLTKKLKESVLASGASFLLLSGCDVKAFQELSHIFEKDGYSEQDLVELERYHSLCMVKNEETSYSCFIAKLPS